MLARYYTLILLLASATIYAQSHHELQEVTVIASRTTNNAEGYTTNLRGSDIAKGKPAVDVLGFLPNISRENGNFKINGLAASEIYVDGVKLSDLSELNNIPGEMIDKVQVKYLAGSAQRRYNNDYAPPSSGGWLLWQHLGKCRLVQKLWLRKRRCRGHDKLPI